MNTTFDMVAKTFQGLEEVLANELRGIGALEVTPGKRMVAFKGDLATLYRANFCCRTALRILKPFYTFEADDADSLYAGAKQFDWSSIMNVGQTFAIDTVVYSDDFRNSQYVTYRIKDAVVDWFRDHSDNEQRPSVRLDGADIMINVHIAGTRVTISLDSSGESLHKRGYRVAQTEAPINEVLAAGIILRSGWRGECPLVDPMCGSGTFLIEAALIAANINPGIYRKGFAFERWADFDQELFDRLYNDDSAERTFDFKIYGADISPKAVEIARANIKSAGVAKYIELERKPLSAWETSPRPAGVLVTNPPYGERISVADMDGLYQTIGSKLKHVFTGYHAWIIGYRDDYFARIGLAPSEKIPLYNGSLECSLREYIIFEGDRRSFVRDGGKIGKGEDRPARKTDGPRAKGRFGDRPERPSRDRADRGDRPERTDRPFRSDKPERRAPRVETPETEPENPLAKRRNPGALNLIKGRRPTLPPQEGPIMRSRGWKKRRIEPNKPDDAKE